MAIVSSPSETVCQLSGYLGEESILSVIAKRTYQFDTRGRLVLAPVQLPLQKDILFEDGSDELVCADTDLVPWKPLTDIVVLGHAQVQEPRTDFHASVRIGSYAKTVLAIGERHATINASGRPVLSAPSPVAKLPLSFGLAYGGRDSVAEAKYGIPGAEHAQYFDISHVENLSPYLYPRNPCGRGYLVEISKESVESLKLPQLEDPTDRLRADHLAAGHSLRWTEMPVPQSLGWSGLAWFPRVAYLGVVPEHEPSTKPLFEVRSGWAPTDVLESKPIEQAFNMRACNGASLGLQVPYLRGDEDGSLHNLSPWYPVLRFVLPGDRPRIWTDGRKGKLNETKPEIHSVVIEPDKARLSITWRGSAPALRPYTDEELQQMPLRVEWR
jgi:hypothetical protein